MIKIFTMAIIILVTTSLCFAGCFLDHFLIGCNQDGISGTADDNKLFVDCTQKYRHSAPDNSGGSTWLYWHYPLYYNIRYDRYQIGEPGFDVIGTSDPNRQLTGTADVDYRIIIECVSITPGFSAREVTLGVLLDEAGDSFNHSALEDKHIHLEYRAPAPSGETELQWITYIVYDELEKYGQSEPFSLVFVIDPPAGDLVVDGNVNIDDLAEFCYYWLETNGSKENDYYERADANKDGYVNFADFTLLASNWLAQ
ncbi:MAG: hypothetical protein CVV39_03650 [Planctomycetes bacterium HGW-Planctomycetes-1]|nr:MAG: hypothetical protein CVV39_03650 [Planctomycetes bacterium HGW-Planctomycetes-1]